MSTSINKLLKIMKKLRDPVSGCPWDIEQDFKSIAPHTIEEAYEVSNAIDQNNFENLKEELGDLLLQVVFHSQMANEIEKFNFDNVVDSIVSKLIRRHPHIFEKENKKITSKEVINQWEKIKLKEKKDEIDIKGTNFDDIPNNFPNTLKSLKIQKKAAVNGFDWENVFNALGKVSEEFKELKDSIRRKNKFFQVEEMGDLLFSCINVCRKLEINPDHALSKANKKFTFRFNKAEKLAESDNKRFSDLPLIEQEKYWQKAKNY